MKKHALILLILQTLFSVELFAQRVDWKFSHSIVSKYLATIGLVPSDDPSFVNEITGSSGDLYFGVWVATGIGQGSYGKSFKDDWDPYIGWGHTFSAIRYDLTGIYFVVADFSRMNDDIWAVDQKVSLSKLSVQPYITVRTFGSVGSKSPEGGLFVWAGVQHVGSVGRLSLNTDVSMSASDGPLGKDPGLVFYKLAHSISIPLKSVAITLSVNYQQPAGRQKISTRPFHKQSELVWGIGLSYRGKSQSRK